MRRVSAAVGAGQGGHSWSSLPRPEHPAPDDSLCSLRCHSSLQHSRERLRMADRYVASTEVRQSEVTSWLRYLSARGVTWCQLL